MRSSLRVQKPPAAEPVDAALLKHHARIDFDADDDLLDGYITAARIWVENYLARALVRQTLVYTLSPHRNAGLPGQIIPLLTFPMGWGASMTWHRLIELPRCPVLSVGAVQAILHSGETLELTPADYRLDLDLEPATLHIRLGEPLIHTLRIAFDAGYGPGEGETPIPVPIIQAILLLATFLYENRGDDRAEIPSAVEMLLTPHRVMFFGG